MYQHNKCFSSQRLCVQLYVSACLRCKHHHFLVFSVLILRYKISSKPEGQLYFLLFESSIVDLSKFGENYLGWLGEPKKKK